MLLLLFLLTRLQEPRRETRRKQVESVIPHLAGVKCDVCLQANVDNDDEVCGPNFNAEAMLGLSQIILCDGCSRSTIP